MWLAGARTAIPTVLADVLAARWVTRVLPCMALHYAPL